MWENMITSCAARTTRLTSAIPTAPLKLKTVIRQPYG